MSDEAIVRCNYCGATYDRYNVKVTARYADCTMYRTPCCDHEADDRTYVSLPSFTKLSDLPNGSIFTTTVRPREEGKQ